MSRYLPGFLTGSGEEDVGITDGAVTRARAAAAAVVAAQQAGLEVPQPQVRGYGRSRSPSPRPGGQFFNESLGNSNGPTMDNAEAIKAAAIAAAEAAIRAMGSTAPKPRKPELPDFDRKNIDIWIKRVEAAYTRVGIVDAKDKFAHLEAKIKVDFDPQINKYLFGEATSARWDEFVRYLRSTYGRSKREEAATILDGVKRDGRRPTQLRSFIFDRIGNISMDEIVREMILRELPTEVQQSLQERADKMTSREVAEAADNFFDQDGRQILSNASSINTVEEPTSEGAEGSDTDINALKFRPKQQGRFQRGGNQSKPFPPKPQNQWNAQTHFTKPFSQNPAPKATPAFNSSQAPNTSKPLCIKHRKFRDKAYSCEPGCPKWDEFNKNAGNGNAGRRM